MCALGISLGLVSPVPARALIASRFGTLDRTGTKDNKLLRWTFGKDYSVVAREAVPVPTGATWHDRTDSGPHELGGGGGGGVPPEPGGLHTLALNSTYGGRELACGGKDPSSILVLDAASLRPRLLLEGNTDW